MYFCRWNSYQYTYCEGDIFFSSPWESNSGHLWVSPLFFYLLPQNSLISIPNEKLSLNRSFSHSLVVNSFSLSLFRFDQAHFHDLALLYSPYSSQKNSGESKVLQYFGTGLFVAHISHEWSSSSCGRYLLWLVVSW